METQLHEFDSVPGTVFKDSFLSFITTVSSMSGDRISDDAFKLDYETVPGTIVRDGTVRAKSAKAGDNYVTYTVPTRTQDLPQVIERASNGENMVRFAASRPWRLCPSLIIFAAVRCRRSYFAMRGCSEPSWRSLPGAAGRIFRNNRVPRNLRTLAVSGPSAISVFQISGPNCCLPV